MALKHFLCALLLLLSGRALGGEVVIQADPGLESMAAKLTKLAPGMLTDIERDLEDLPHVGTVRVRLVKHQEDLAAAAPNGAGAPTWAIGMAYPEAGLITLAARGRDGSLTDVEHTLAHELAHMALGKALSPEIPPRWLNEGFAYLHASDSSVARAETLMGAVIAGRIKGMAELEATFPEREDEAALAYAESYDFVAWLAKKDPSRASFRELLSDLARGDSLEVAALQSYGSDFVTLEREWKDSVHSRYLWYWVGLGAVLLWILGALLLVLGWRRRRRVARATLAKWEIEEALEDSAKARETNLLN